MTTANFMSKLRELGVELKADGENLLCNAPKGVLTPTVQSELAARKAEVITFLQTQANQSANDRSSIELTDRDNRPPLSFAQERLWYLDQLEPNKATYNIPSAVKIEGALDADLLQRSLNDVLRRHEILRTCFGIEDDSPVQVIEPVVELDLPLLDFSHLSAETREREVHEYLLSQANRPFDLTVAPLVRASCIRIQETEHILFFMAHHTVFDGSSLGLLLHELSSTYDALLTGEPSPLDDVVVQYADYAIWQRNQLDEGELGRLLAYWREQLDGNLPTLQMPTDRPRPAKQSYQGSAESIMLQPELVDKLTKLGREDGATLFMVLFTAFNVLLHRYTAQDDFIVGTPVNSRNRLEFEQSIGFYVNTLALRTDVSGDPSFRKLLAQVRRNCLGAYGHQEMPFEKLVQEFETSRDLSRTPLFQALFAFQDTSNRSFDSSGLKWTTLRVDNRVSRTDLSFWINRTDDGLSAIMEYSSDLFESETIARMLGHYRNLLEGIVLHHDVPISELPLLDDDERHRILVDWNATRIPYPDDARVHELFEAQARATPDAVAVVFDNDSVTYSELNRRANQLAHHLAAVGVVTESLVGICIDRSIDMVVGLLAVLKAGGAYVPLDPDFPKDRLAYMLADAEIGVMLTNTQLLRQLPEHTGTVVCLDSDEDDIAQRSDANPSITGNPDDLAYVIYTSGSTGKPKGVQVPHRGVVNFLTSMRAEPGLTHSDRLLAVTTLSFDIAVLELFLPLAVGASIIIASRETAADGHRLLDTISSSRVTVMQATPATWRLMIAAGWDESLPIKVLCGGEPMPSDLARDLVARSNCVWNLYGPTETTIWSTCHRISDAEQPILIGHPILNTEVYVLDDRQRPVPIGVPGELYIGGAGVTRGYLNRPQLSAERFLPDVLREGGGRLYRTGDLARWRPDGSLEHLGRIDSQVKVRGYRIELGEIETVLSEYPGIERCAVSVWEADADDHRLVAYFVVGQGERLDKVGLRKHLSNQLPAYMLPQHYVAVEEIPLTPNGKVDRKQLPAPSVTGSGNSIQAPATDAEKLLASVWSRLLGVEHIGSHDNFFNLGGHSLLAVKAVLEIEKATGSRIDLRQILLEDLSQIASNLQVSRPEDSANRYDRPTTLFQKLFNWRRRA